MLVQWHPPQDLKPPLSHADNLPRLYVQQTGSGIYSRQNLGAPKSEATRVMENINDFVIFLLPTVVRLS